MIGNQKILIEIEERLKEIAHLNKQKFGHILDYTDFPRGTNITLGTVKKDYDSDSRIRVFFDIIFGDFTYRDGSPVILHDKYFSLSESFEDDLERRLEGLNNAFDGEREEELKTIERLEKILNG